MYHPVTTDVESLPERIKNTINAMIESGDNYIVIYPNNDHGSEIIINELSRLEGNSKFKIFPSIRFEFFLTLLKNSTYMLGNSSAGVREAPFYGLPTINLGSRQNNRSTSESIMNSEEVTESILKLITMARTARFKPTVEFGNGKSYEIFYKLLQSEELWDISKQKVFVDYLGAKTRE